MRNTLLLLTALLAGCLSASAAKAVAPDTSYYIKSPDKQVYTTISLKDGNALVQVNYSANDMMRPSHIAMRLTDAARGKKQWTLGEGIKKLPRVTIDTVLTDRDTPHSTQQHVTDKATRLTLNFGDYDIVALASNGGAAYRFVTRIKGQVRVVSETNDLRLPPSSTLCYQLAPTYAASFERTYKKAQLGKVEQGIMLAPQLMMTTANGRVRMVLSDYDVRDYPGLYWQLSGDTLQSVFAPVPKTIEETGRLGSRTQVTERESYIALTTGTRAFPWKMMATAEHDYDMLQSHFAVQLAPECQLADPSWIVPGKAAWEWWNNCDLTGVDFTAGVNDSTYQAYIDFAAANGLQYVIIDAGWTAPQRPIDLLKSVPEVNIEHLVSYARERGVGIVLWADYHPFEQNMQQVVETYARMGVKGFKIDHFNRNDQQVVQLQWRIAELCAQHNMVVSFHGTMPPTGLQYAWPNVLSFEAVHGMERMRDDNGVKPDQVTYDVTFPFIRQVVGPADYTPGAMRNSTRAAWHASKTQPMSQGTRARQAAAYVVFSSPLSVLCDSPSAYSTPYNKPWTEFVSQIPTTWDETHVMRGTLGRLIVIARRKGDVWWIAGMTDWATRSNFRLILDFVKNGRHLTVLSDGQNADRDATDYRIDKLDMGENIYLDLDMKGGGGFVMKVE